MELSALPPSLINLKWYSCIFFSFLGFVSFFILLNQGWLPDSSIPSLLYPPERPASGEPSVPLSPPSPKSPQPRIEEQGRMNMTSTTTKAVVPAEVPLLPPSPNIEVKSSEISPEPGVEEQGGMGMISTNDVRPAASPPTPTPPAECDIFDGRWVYDQKAYPLYHGYQCPFLSDQVTCRKNGRPDSGYEHWRWEAKGCEIPRFNGIDMLERLRGKRVVIVGDSLNRNQWESMVCLLYSAAADRSSRTSVKLNSEYKIFRAKDYNCTVEFFWSPFLVPLERAKDGFQVLKLDKLPSSANRWRGADIMVFNSGHWWTHRGGLKKWSFLESKGLRVEEMEGVTAFETAMKTWARWIDQSVDPTKTSVFFRSISPEHKRESNHWCYNQTHPITNETYIQWFPSSMVSAVERTIQEMKTPVKYLNITKLSEYRRDSHTAIYTTRGGKLLTIEERKQPEMYSDCSHWCLPGLPDTWNVLIYASMVATL